MRLTVAYYLLLLTVSTVAGRVVISPPLDAALGLLALLLVVIAALGRIWSSVFIAGRKDTELVTGGPYAVCRHPLYLFSLVGGLGIGMATRSLALTLLTLVVLAVLHVRAASKEERVLAERHGATFGEYCARVRWWPRWPGSRARDRLEVAPAVFWKAFVDASAFLLLYGLVELARALRISGLLPTFVWLP